MSRSTRLHRVLILPLSYLVLVKLSSRRGLIATCPCALPLLTPPGWLVELCIHSLIESCVHCLLGDRERLPKRDSYL